MPATAYALKRCTACRTEKPLEQFARDRSRKDGCMSYCRECDNARAKQRYRDKVNATPRPYGRPKEPAPALPPRTCFTCDTEYQPTRKDQRYCGPGCRRIIVTCGYCGAPVHKERREVQRHTRSFCNPACRNRGLSGAPSVSLVGPVAAGITQRIANAPRPLRFTARQCRCGNWITAVGQRVPKTCGCSTPTPSERDCHECGKTFMPIRPNQNYCTPEHAKRSRRRRDKQARDKRIKAAGPRDRIGLATIAKRDAWRCHICKRKVGRGTWSLDHLIPLVDGGTHTWDNVALAHHRCNSLRSNVGPAQLMLLG